MKLSSALIVATYAQDDDKKVPPRHPLQRLERLVEFSEEIMNDWFTFLPSQLRWKQKFRTNADRMARGFARCGYYDPALAHGGPGKLLILLIIFIFMPQFQNQLIVKEETP